ncbi:hypothetical protein KZ810_13000 [Sphingomonas sp. RHCKR47]|uniref:hypothetical protein n=1 Tax=Sphingomonas citricola TaxID=2862498 RepID=UPI001CA551CA|nr:hypothetical protein [Sphingomonas citricola]MBW6524419.1 hypothetical protein [Sphingomonas citricola]
MFALCNAKPVEHELIPAIGDNPPVKVTFPAQPSLLSLRAARRATVEALRGGGAEAEERAADAFTTTLIRHNIVSWSGIGDADGKPVEPTQDVEHRDVDGNVTSVEPGTISMFLAEPRLVEAADQLWVLPWAMADAEKNGLSLSPNGTSAGATQEADTASSSATPESSADAETTPADQPAPTSDTKRARKRAK